MADFCGTFVPPVWVVALFFGALVLTGFFFWGGTPTLVFFVFPGVLGLILIIVFGIIDLIEERKRGVKRA